MYEEVSNCKIYLVSLTDWFFLFHSHSLITIWKLIQTAWPFVNIEKWEHLVSPTLMIFKDYMLSIYYALYIYSQLFFFCKRLIHSNLLPYDLPFVWKGVYVSMILFGAYLNFRQWNVWHDMYHIWAETFKAIVCYQSTYSFS